MKKFLIFFLLLSTPVFATTDAPLEISAKHSLEWNRKNKTYTAREDAVAKQGNLEVSADNLVAHYADAKGATDIDQLTATGQVVIRSTPYTATGERAIYKTSTGNATLTGGDLKITTPDEIVTAEDRIEFFSRENRLTATGNAVAKRGTDTLSAPVMNAFFITGADGKMAMDKITAEGGVTIKTARETVTGDRGVYDVSAGKATLTGKIRILQDESWIEGNRAVVDLKTGISQLFSDGASKGDGRGGNGSDAGRVRGVFYPKKKQ